MAVSITAYKLKDNEIMSGSFEGNSGYKDDFKPRAAQKTQRFVNEVICRYNN